MALVQAGLTKRWKGLPDGVHRPYRRFLVNKLRENFNFKVLQFKFILWECR